MYYRIVYIVLIGIFFIREASVGLNVDVDVLASMVLLYLNCYVFLNERPWMNGEVRSLLRARNRAFKANDIVACKTARFNLKSGSRIAKTAYSRKIESHFEESRDARAIWNGLKCISDYKSPAACKLGGPSAADFNNFYERFENGNKYPTGKICFG